MTNFIVARPDGQTTTYTAMGIFDELQRLGFFSRDVLSHIDYMKAGAVLFADDGTTIRVAPDARKQRKTVAEFVDDIRACGGWFGPGNQLSLDTARLRVVSADGVVFTHAEVYYDDGHTVRVRGIDANFSLYDLASTEVTVTRRD